MNNKDLGTPSSTRKGTSPAKRWTVGGVLLAIVVAIYSAARPVINERYGINLPAINASNGGQENHPESSDANRKQDSIEPKELDVKPPASEAASPKTEAAKPAREATNPAPKAETKSATASKAPPITVPPKEKVNPPEKSPDKSPEKPAAKPPAKPTVPPKTQAPAKKTTAPSENKDLLYGILRSLPRDEFVSPAGLRYTPGSEEGHRLKHLERHTQDQPTRPGNHGVFLGGMEGALKVIDEAYLKAKEGGKNVKVEEDRGRTVYTVDLRRKVGYIGGQDGNRRNKPTAFRVQIVLDEDRVITAYPR